MRRECFSYSLPQPKLFRPLGFVVPFRGGSWSGVQGDGRQNLPRRPGHHPRVAPHRSTCCFTTWPLRQLFQSQFFLRILLFAGGWQSTAVLVATCARASPTWEGVGDAVLVSGRPQGGLDTLRMWKPKQPFRVRWWLRDVCALPTHLLSGHTCWCCRPGRQPHAIAH